MLGASIASAGLATTGGGVRGRQDAAGVHPVVAAPGQRVTPPAASLALWAKITGATSIGGNRWAYNWEEVAPSASTPGTFTVVTGGRTSATWGIAYNTIEAGNEGAGIEGTGVDQATLPAGFEMQPIGNGAVVLLTFLPFSASVVLALFTAMNHYDGSCPGTAASVERETSDAALTAIGLTRGTEDGEDEIPPVVAITRGGNVVLTRGVGGFVTEDRIGLASIRVTRTRQLAVGRSGVVITGRDCAAAPRALIERIVITRTGATGITRGGAIAAGRN